MFRKNLALHHTNYRGRIVNQKIIVFESDDWGSVRMPSKLAYESIKKSTGLALEKSPYCLYDSLECSEDLMALFDVLTKYKDSNGNHPCITANTVMANPDFEKIKADNFSNYHFETLDKSFERIHPDKNPFNLFFQGINAKLFFPQFHGREHVNVGLWLHLLQNNDPVFKKAFEWGCWGISTDVYKKYRKSIQAAFDYDSFDQLPFLEISLVEGLDLFNTIFKFPSLSFIPNNYIWPTELNETIKLCGIKYLQGSKYQFLPKQIGEVKRKKIRRYTGINHENDETIIQMLRNVRFEPSLHLNRDKSTVLKDCLTEISNSFFWRKPAVISMHRINFCSSLDENNRNQNLLLLDSLIKTIIKKWPDVIFLNSVQLGFALQNNQI